MKKRDSVISLLFIILTFQPLSAQPLLTDSAKISLLTASPWWDAIYAFFGHTAIRVQDESAGIDAVFNYGYFDSSQPNFIYKFVRGETDYMLGVTSLNDYLREYGYKGQEVVEQTLNLSSIEKQRLYDALYINAQPENMRYRYNYFYDNCATRPRDMIEQNSQLPIIYPHDTLNQSFRDLIHESVRFHPWVKFGIDLVIGNEADRIIDLREKFYIPSYLMNSVETASFRINDDTVRPLLNSSEILLPLDSERNNPGEGALITPMAVAFALLILTLLLSLMQLGQLTKIKLLKIYDSLIFGIAGLAGLVLFIMIFFSEHPATNPNWNFVWLNIAALFVPFLFWFKAANRVVYFYHFINFVVITLFILLWWLIPQKLPIETIPFSMSLLIRSGTNLFSLKKTRIRNSRFTSSRYMKAGWGQ